jgi:hypothetical protein
VAAYWHDHGKSILLRSGDGIRWEEISVIREGDGNDETAIAFLPDRRLLATARLEVTLSESSDRFVISTTALATTDWSDQLSGGNSTH